MLELELNGENQLYLKTKIYTLLRYSVFNTLKESFVCNCCLGKRCGLLASCPNRTQR